LFLADKRLCANINGISSSSSSSKKIERWLQQFGINLQLG
jgi:arsenate reductase-like glutaredoxin family protein